jgi:hypothetical protein
MDFAPIYNSLMNREDRVSQSYFKTGGYRQSVLLSDKPHEAHDPYD